MILFLAWIKVTWSYSFPFTLIFIICFLPLSLFFFFFLFALKFHELKWIESSYMASMRFKAMRAKKWWLETIQFLNTIRSTHKLPSTYIYNEIEKRNIVPLQLTRISSPDTARTSTRHHNPRRTYPLSVGCIDFETDANLMPIPDDGHFIEIQKKFRRRKKNKRNRKLCQSLIELHKIQ